MRHQSESKPKKISLLIYLFIHKFPTKRGRRESKKIGTKTSEPEVDEVDSLGRGEPGVSFEL